jgi:hypothetical protein
MSWTMACPVARRLNLFMNGLVAGTPTPAQQVLQGEFEIGCEHEPLAE